MRNSQVQLDRNDGHTCYHVLKILGMLIDFMAYVRVSVGDASCLSH